jgi:hypothetical protein
VLGKIAVADIDPTSAADATPAAHAVEIHTQHPRCGERRGAGEPPALAGGANTTRKSCISVSFQGRLWPILRGGCEQWAMRGSVVSDRPDGTLDQGEIMG